MEMSISERRICDSDGYEAEREIACSFKVFLTKSDGPRVFRVQLHRLQLLDSSIACNPFITMGKRLPRDSPIFDVVLRGDVGGLQNLISRREATLWDRDTDGTPLLFVRLSLQCHTIIIHKLMSISMLGHSLTCVDSFSLTMQTLMSLPSVH